MANVDVWVSNQITLRFGWWQDSQSVANNSSVVGWHLQLIASGGSISSSSSKSWSVTVNGKKYSGTNTVGISNGATKTLASGSTTIAHNADGTKTFSFSFSQQFDISYSGVGWIGTKSGSGSGTLTTIPRASSVSSTSGNIGENITITINRASSSFTHTLTYDFNGLTGTIATKTSSTSISWTIPTSFADRIPGAKSSRGKIICKAYNGGTLIGTSECKFDAYVKDSTNQPTLSPTVKDTNATTIALTGDENKFIKYYSSAKFSFGASAKNGATIKTYSLIVGSQQTSNSTGTFQNVDSASFVFGVVDSRGFSTIQTVNKTLINYVKLTCAMTVSNPTASGECQIKITGKYFSGNFGATSNKLTVQYNMNSGGWINATATISGTTYTATINLTGLDYTQNYTFQARAIDKLATVTSSSKTVKSTPIFDWGSDDFHFHVDVVSNQSLRIGKYQCLYGTGNDDSYVTLAYVNQTNNASEFGTSTLHTTIKSGDVPTWYSGTDGETYDIWTGKDCVRSSGGSCQTWRFPNGMQVSIIQVYGTWDITTAWGKVYSSPFIGAQSFNIAFLEVPRVIINAHGAGTAIMVCQAGAPTTSATGSIYLWKPTQQTGVKNYIEYVAIGRWK